MGKDTTPKRQTMTDLREKYKKKIPVLFLILR